MWLVIVSLMFAAQDKGEWFGRGINAYGKGMYGEAAVNFTRAIEADSMNHIFWFNRATCWVKLRDYDKAIFDLDRCLQLEPTATNALMQRAVAHAEMRNVEQAVRDVSKVIEIDPKFPKAYLLRGRLLLQKGEKVEACKDLKVAEEQGDPNAAALRKQSCE